MKRALLIGALLAACGDDAALPCGVGSEPRCDGNSQDECEQAGVDARGECTADGVSRCVDHHVVKEPCGVGTQCEETVDALSCVALPCDWIGPLGRCDGDILDTCGPQGQAQTDCTASGKSCSYIDSATGYGCVEPGSVGALSVSGVVSYEDRPQLTDGKLGPIERALARGTTVSVVRDATQSVLAVGVTADDGSYRLHFNAAAGEAVHVLAASVNPTSARPVKVVNRQGRVHGFGGTSFPAAATTTSDVLATETSQTAEAFNILDVTIRTMDMIRDDLGHATPAPLTLAWAKGSTGTWYDGNGKIYLLGESSDDDGYDDTVILHETGHHVEDTEGREDSAGGPHDGSPTDPNLAWSEGFSTYLSMALTGRPFYMDSNASGGWGYDGDLTITPAVAAGGMAQDISEDTVTECLWDLGDAPTASTSDDDGVAGSHAAMFQVQSGYLKSVPLRGAGEPGVDLVDFLDGWFVSQGLATCSGAREIVTTVRKFPYDYAGPAGTCP